MVQLLTSVAIGVLALTGAIADDATKSMNLRIASHAHLNDATALVNKNMALHSNNIAITHSNIMGTQNDDVRMDEGDALPKGIVMTGETEPLKKSESLEYYGGYGYGRYGYRHRFYYPYYNGGYYGWRYPISYWNTYGNYYGGGCPFGRYYGDYYYC